MTSYKIKSKFLSATTTTSTKQVDSAVNSNGEKSKMDSLLRTRHSVNNSSGSSIKSTSSSESSSNLSAINNEFLNVKVIFPNGFETVKKIESKKAIYDLLIELSASAKLIPTNFMLKLYSQDENNNIYDDDKLIEYTPNQTIGQLNPTKIKILPKTATLKHHHALQDVNSNKLSISIQNINSKINYYHHSNTNTSSSTPSSSSTKPFELTKCVQVNLPFNQKTIVRTKPEIKLTDLFDLICKEANLDRNKYDLVLPNQTKYSMQDSFVMFDTKEVSLVLKQSSNNEQSKLLNSKSTHSIYVQNSSNNNNHNNKKSIINSHLIKTNSSQTSNRDSLLRSKSEIDIKTESSTMLATRNTTNLELKTPETGKRPQENIITPAKFTAKKKIAPPPPQIPSSSSPSTTQIEQSLNKNESIKSKDFIDESSTTKLTSATKRKAPAPPPPPTPQQSQQQLQMPVKKAETVNDQLKIDTCFNSSPKSEHSIDYSSSLSETNHQENEKINTSSSASSSPPPPHELNNYSVPSSPASSACSHNTNKSEKQKVESRQNSLIMPVVKTHIHYNPTIQKYHNSLISSSNGSSPTFQTKSSESTKENEITSVNVNILNNIIVARKLSIQSTSSDIEDSFENSVTSGSSSKLDKYHDDAQLNHEIESIAENEYESINTIETNINNTNEINNLGTNDKEISIHGSNLSIYTNKNDKSIDESLLLQSNLRGKFYGKLCDQKTFSEDDFSDIDSLKAANSPMLANTKFTSLQHIEVSRYQQYLNKCDEMSQITKIEVSLKSDLNNNNLNDTIKEEEKSVKKIIKNEKRPELNKLTYVNTAEPNDYVKAKPIKEEQSKPRALVSPVPQFPAIGADELSQQHQNYTVVRSGEIIEKNGTYYSTDGTVRGYSGIVKKIANSKTLNEIFTKQFSELEQQHEREYKQELEQKQKQEEELQKKMNSLDRFKQQQQIQNAQKRQSLPYQGNGFMKGRTSLGNIIMNEKNSKSNTLSSYVIKQSNTTENELAKKLEERANKIAAATNKPLQIDTNLKPLDSASNSSSSSSYNTNQASASSSSTTNASSPRSPSSTRAAYTKIYDLKNEHKIQDTSSSSSSSLSTFSYEPLKNVIPKPVINQTKSNTLNIIKSSNTTKKNNNVKSIDFHSMLLNEIKSIVPLVEDINSVKKIESTNEKISTASTASSLIKLANPVGSQATVIKPPPPPTNPPQVAPKNFTSDAVKSLNKKTQIIDARDNLLDSIRSFSASSLRKVDLNNK